MSFKEYKDEILQGDTVILYININSMYAITVEPFIKNKSNEMVENVFQTKYGALKVISLAGKKYGSQIQLSKGWAYILHPTPELWTLTLPHRTQIIYSMDISIIIHQLELKPGSIAIESGTGSGSLSHALVRAVQPNGHLYTFDFHEARVDKAKEEFESHYIGDLVTIKQRDVCSDGFGDDVLKIADAVFLDLPHPWLAVPFAALALKEVGGRFCSFSPCIEQVQRTCLALHKEGFVELSTMECLQKEYQVSTRSYNVLNLDQKEQDTSEEGRKVDKIKEELKQAVGVAPLTMPGHTGFLTFATLPPVWARKIPKD